MAKKIIKEPTIRRYKATCPICGCEFEFDTADAYWSEFDGYDNYKDCRVDCPICKTTIRNQQTEINE